MKTRRRLVVASTLVAVLCCGGPSWSADEAEEGPRIGLALSGGGALGAAHVGVLRVLEELHVPVHYVAGTSMGAIVGGLYAAGVSPDEMEEILAGIDWRALLDDRPDRRAIPYRRKVDDQTFLTRFEMGFNHGSFQLPSGLITGQELGLALQTLTLRTAGISDFDDLPIPFRAVATDISNGEMVVLGHGDLGHAIRASMSIPAVFSPVEIDGRLLVDGGYSRNMPVDVVRAMGADVVIAVDLGQEPPSAEELISMASMTGQVMGLNIRKNVEEQVEHADVLIEPELAGYGSMEFESCVEMIPEGAEAAREKAAELRGWALVESEFAKYMERVRKTPELPATISSVQLTDSSVSDSRFLFRQLRTRPGDPFDIEKIGQDLRRLYETGDYERVDFFLTGGADDLTLHVETHEKPWGPNILRFGVNLTMDFEGESSIDLLANYTMPRLNRWRGELKLSTQLGENPQVQAEFYQPLSRAQTWFVAPWIAQTNATGYESVEGPLVARYRSRLSQGGLDLGLQLGRYGELRLGVVRGSGEAELDPRRDSETPSDLPTDLDFDIGGYRVQAVIDQFDNMNFPRRGYLGYLRYFRERESLGSDRDTEHLTAFLGAAASRDRHSVLALVDLTSALGSEQPALVSLGGLFSLSGYEPGSIVGSYGGKVSLLYLYRLARLPTGFGDGIYLGGSVEAGNLWAESGQVSTGDLLYSASLCIGVDTLLGPVYLAQGFSEHGSEALYLYIGRSF